LPVWILLLAGVHKLGIDLILEWTALAIEYLFELDLAVYGLVLRLSVVVTPVCVLVLQYDIVHF